MSATSPAQPKGSAIATVLRVTSGNFLEMFDFFLFGFYATYISRRSSRPATSSPR